MSESQRRKAVYFSADELQLKDWAEKQPCGFSTYIKSLIVADQKGDMQKKVISQALQEFINSDDAKQFLQRSLNDVLEGRVITPLQKDDVGLDIEEARTIVSLINGI